METTRKTKKFYRELISQKMLNTPVDIISEVLKKYAPANKWWTEIYLGDKTKFCWNHKIERVGLNRETKCVYLDVYWQGDSTDGKEAVSLASVLAMFRLGRDYIVPAEHEWLGNGTYCKHSDLRISKEEVENAYKAIVAYLQKPSAKTRSTTHE